MNEKLYKVNLNFSELLMLDGKVHQEVQDVIDDIKKCNSFGFEFHLINEIINTSLKKGTFSYSRKEIRNCSYCDKIYTYHTYPKNTKKNIKGEFNYNSPKYYYGYSFNDGFITVKGHGDICEDCEKVYKVISTVEEYILSQRLPVQLLRNKDLSIFYKDDIKICYNCKEEMCESEMGRSNAVFGGTYASTCPKCGAVSTAFGKLHTSTNKFVMREK